MIGQGVLLECIADASVTEVLVVARTTIGSTSPKVREIIQADFFYWPDLPRQTAQFDACFFCLGVSSVGMKEPEYRRLTYDLTLGAAEAMVQRAPGMTFIYVSGMGTDSTEKGRTMWARVKGATENALRALPFRAVYLFRPGYVQPLHGVRSKVGWYNGIYAVVSWMYPVLRRVAPKYMTTTEAIGKAMIAVARSGYRRAVLEPDDIARAAGER
jgi:uncharacterized protein YbjT (DUF2867 family)